MVAIVKSNCDTAMSKLRLSLSLSLSLSFLRDHPSLTLCYLIIPHGNCSRGMNNAKKIPRQLDNDVRNRKEFALLIPTLVPLNKCPVSSGCNQFPVNWRCSNCRRSQICLTRPVIFKIFFALRFSLCYLG